MLLDLRSWRIPTIAWWQPATPGMPNIPSEILHRIFQLACTDDGSTGRALSLASTRFHDISAPYKYYSLHVIGAVRIARFASFLEAYHPPVQYLKLDCTTPDVKPSMLSLTTFLRKFWRWPRNTDPRVISANTGLVFRNLASTLKGLWLISANAPVNLSPFTFPVLKTFYLRDNYYDVSKYLIQSRFSALKVLDITCNRNEEPGYSRPAFIYRIVFPSLTHFGCCSHVGQGRWALESLAKSNDSGCLSFPDYGPNYVLGLENFLALDALRVKVSKSRLPQIRGMIESVNLIKGFPESTAKVHDVTEAEDIMDMEEWSYYVVEGGEGFLMA